MFRPSTPSRGAPHGPSAGRHRAPPPRRVVARRQLPHRRPDLPAGQPAAARAAATRAHQAPAARPLGHLARAQPPLRPPQPGDPPRRPRRDLRGRARATAARRCWPTSTSRAPTPRSTRRSRRDLVGLQRLFRQFSTPGGIPSHVSVPTPGSIHEGGELGYALVHAFGAAFDNPDLDRGLRGRRRRGRDRPARGLVEEHPLPEPGARRRGAADPAPQRLQDLRAHRARPGAARRRARAARGPRLRRARGRRRRARRRCTATLAGVPRPLRRRRSGRSRHDARTAGVRPARPRWPAIVLRTPKGWTGPEDGRRRARSRAPSAPTRCRWPSVRDEPGAPRASSRSGCAATGPRSCSTTNGRLGARPRGARARRATGAWAPTRRPTAAAARAPPRAARLAPTTRVEVPAPGAALPRVDPAARRAAARRLPRQRRRRPTSGCSAPTRPTRTGSAPCSRRRPLPRRAHGRRRRPRVARRAGHGGAQRAPLPRLARGLHAHRAPRPVRHLRGLRHGVGVDDGAAHQVARGAPGRCRGGGRSRRSTSCSPRPAGATTTTASATRARASSTRSSPSRATVARVYLPPDANCLLSVADHCLRSRDYVNLIVIDKQPQLQYLDADAAAEHCAAGAGIWAWAGTEEPGDDPDVVLACAGDIPTMETAGRRRAAARARARPAGPGRQRRRPDDAVAGERPPARHDPRRVRRARSPRTRHVVFAFHGYAGAVHELLHGQADADRFHVRGYREQGTTTTPFDMVVLNEMSRYHLAAEALRRSRRLPAGAAELADHCDDMLAAPPRLRPRAPRGHARGPGLDLARVDRVTPRPRAVRQRRLVVAEAGAVRTAVADGPRASSGAGRAPARARTTAVELRPALDELVAAGVPAARRRRPPRGARRRPARRAGRGRRRAPRRAARR